MEQMTLAPIFSRNKSELNTFVIIWMMFVSWVFSLQTLGAGGEIHEMLGRMHSATPSHATHDFVCPRTSYNEEGKIWNESSKIGLVNQSYSCEQESSKNSFLCNKAKSKFHSWLLFLSSNSNSFHHQFINIKGARTDKITCCMRKGIGPFDWMYVTQEKAASPHLAYRRRMG